MCMARESKFTQEEMFDHTKELLLQHGYAGFHFGLLAKRLKVSRVALYKYFQNKDELITEFMVVEMEGFMKELKKISSFPSFTSQLDYLIEVISRYNKIHQILSLVFRIQDKTNENVEKNLELLHQYHLHMYRELDEFIEAGKKNNFLKQTIPNQVLLGFIFQAISIPNHGNISDEDWITSIKELIYHGIFH